MSDAALLRQPDAPADACECRAEIDDALRIETRDPRPETRLREARGAGPGVFAVKRDERYAIRDT